MEKFVFGLERFIQLLIYIDIVHIQEVKKTVKFEKS